MASKTVIRPIQSYFCAVYDYAGKNILAADPKKKIGGHHALLKEIMKFQFEKMPFIAMYCKAFKKCCLLTLSRKMYGYH